ncbi:MAG: FtsX-like permease family protein [Cyclobacteriaceae bacterium]
MVKNYFKTAYRNLLRNKVFAILNIAGLALGIGCSLVIYKVIVYENGFDTYRENYDNIYRLVSEEQNVSGLEYESGVPFPMSEAVRNDFTDFESVTGIISWESLLVTLEDGTKFREEIGTAFSEPQFLKMFGFEILHGKRVDYLTNPDEVLISESLAEKYFGYSGSNPEVALGQQLTLDNAARQTVSAIFEDQPEQTDFPFTLFCPYDLRATLEPIFSDLKNWEMVHDNNHCYLVVNKNVDLQSTEAAFEPFIDKYRVEEAAARTTMKLQPLSEEHFSTKYDNYSTHAARKDFLIALAIIGIFLIVTGAVNFINMATAQSVLRAKEVGIRKVLGGQKSQLIFQLVSETFLITLVALVIALGLSELFFIQLQQLLGYRLHLNLLGSPDTIVALFVILIVVTLLSGLYPAILMSRNSPVSALKTKAQAANAGGSINVRRGLVILQFSISQFLIFSTLVVSSQMEYFQDASLGFQTENILGFPLPDNDPTKLELLRTQLLTNPQIENVTFGLGSPNSDSNATTRFSYPKGGSDDQHVTNFKPADENYIDVFELDIIAGRGLRKSDDSVIVINETMVVKMGLSDPLEAIGEQVQAWGPRTIVGVVADFHTYSLHEEKVPTVLFKNQRYFFQGLVKINGNNYTKLNETISFIEDKWAAAYPEHLFDYGFLDDFIQSQYEAEQRVASLYKIFSGLAIFIGCLGLYGLIAFVANQKTKEIGIRKVLGATIGNILSIFSKELIILMGVAFILSTPLAYFIINDWLNGFHYRIEIGVSTFIAALAVTFLIAISTMGYNSLRAAFANPVKSLRDE